MPDESESPSGGWRAVYNEMEVSTSAETTVIDSDEKFYPRSHPTHDGFSSRMTVKLDARVPVADEEK